MHFGFIESVDKYRELAGDPTWFANSLIANAAKEAEGSKLLWEFGGRIGDEKVAELRSFFPVQGQGLSFALAVSAADQAGDRSGDQVMVQDI